MFFVLFFLIDPTTRALKEKEEMDKDNEVSGGREPPTVKESGVLRGTLSSSEAAERNRVRAAHLRAVGKDLPVLSDGRGRPAKNRLAGLPQIPEEQGERLPNELPEVDAATEARLLEENPPKIPSAVADDDGLQLGSEAAVEELHQLIADRQAEGEEPRQRSLRRPELLGPRSDGSGPATARVQGILLV